MEFWQNDELESKFAAVGYRLNMRGNLALILIEKWGTVAGHIRDKEDTAGRAVLDVMPVADVIERAFDMADLAVTELELREWIKPVEMTLEDLAKQQGTADMIRDRVRYEVRLKDLEGAQVAGVKEKEA